MSRSAVVDQPQLALDVVEVTAPPALEGSRARIVLRNSGANLVRVASTSLVALAMPVALVSVLRPGLYAEWALLFGLAGFVLYLDFGLPASVQTLVSRSLALRRAGEARGHALAGIAWSGAIGAAMLLGLGGAAAASHALFPGLPRGDDQRIVAVVLLVGLGNVATFVGNTASAFYAGHQRSGVSALVLVPGRVASLVLAGMAAILSQDIVSVALAYAAPLVAGGTAMVVAVLAARPSDRTRSRDATAVLRFSGPLAAWSVYMLCISGAGIVIVGRVDFRAVAIFSLATAFASALTGVLSATASPMLSELGRHHEDRERLTSITLIGTRLIVALVVVGVAGVESLYIVAAGFLRQAQSVPAAEAAVILAFTVLAAGLRLTVTPLTYAFVACGVHRRLLLPPLGEAVATLAATIGLGVLFGGAGVAAGLLVGACAGVSIAILWSHRATRVVAMSAGGLAAAAVLRPVLALLPTQAVFALLVLVSGGAPALWPALAGATAMLLGAVFAAATLCLPPDLRTRLDLRTIVRRRTSGAGA